MCSASHCVSNQHTAASTLREPYNLNCTKDMQEIHFLLTQIYILSTATLQLKYLFFMLC